MTDAARKNQETRERKRRYARLIRRILALLAIALVVGAIVLAWMPKAVPVDVARVKRGPFEVTVDEDGKTRVKDRYLVSAPLMAHMARLTLEAGDDVQPGAILARLLPLPPQLLDPRSMAQAEARVAAARAGKRQSLTTIARVETELRYAEREAQRQRSLKSSGAVAEAALERAELEARALKEEHASAEFAAKVADQELAMALAALGRIGKTRAGDEDEQFELVSPVKGRVLRVIQESEGVVQPGTPLLEIGDPSALEIVVDVLTSDAVEIKPGTPARIERWGGDRVLRAHVRMVEPSAFTRLSALGVEEQRVNAVIDIDEPRSIWSALGDGYRVEARMTVWRGEAVLQAPMSATFRQGDGWAVFTVREGKARQARVEIGHRNSRAVEIVGGLREGETVIVHPGDRVADGVRVGVR
ncbi:MAG: HlyD family efflux transporter periplasmic adaptor subunit [Deltaproteobacteria bacterium]|nr:HlyD family efflux transporter periplasmic adaptor subunit [Deltaproteobacteria bacterium]